MGGWRLTVYNLGFTDLRFKACGLRFGAYGLQLTVYGLRFTVYGYGLHFIV